jgi:hypothetical protein
LQIPWPDWAIGVVQAQPLQTPKDDDTLDA